MEIKTQITINAPAEKVWAALLRFEQYPKWNPFIHSITGPAEMGKNIRVKIKPPGGQAMVFKPVILRRVENEELRWQGKVMIKGLLDGEHYFLLQEQADGKTLFTHGERFTGMLARFFTNTLAKTEHGFIAMNEALKAVCEA